MTISESLLKHTASKIEAPDHAGATLGGGMPDYTSVGTNVKCRVEPETKTEMNGVLGRWPTGRYSLLFPAGTDVQVGYKVTVGTTVYLVDEAGSYDTYVLAYGRVQ